MAELTTIARPYAQAVFRLAREQQNLDAWSDMLGLMAVVASDPDMQRLLDNPRLTEDQLAGFFLEICGERLNAEGRNLVRVLAENRRLAALPEMFRLYQEHKSAAEGAIKAELITAYPATEAHKATVLEALKQRFGREVELECRTDQNLVGGAIIRAGDTVIDGSVRGKLARLATALSH
ncbi:ATP synthase subunit delta [Thiohalobacter sp. COW1]|uniref:ATP synthase subunit delta n=1 Tax=Thiohalobacter thiocyanaticus TaxID=585455 RepID=A0A1Z4VMH0_9GAMM|nr:MULTISPECIES: F0F1 ATP synthase subunit delta [Thiohalobacter]BAZ92632.1 ATP synthase subunit delta [Thiohalobacter thiocyanaticus]BCO32401.1 ATP synthase subunit delta [Thiohalobacter sp. COW1]